MTNSDKKSSSHIFDYTLVKKIWAMLPTHRKRGAIGLWLLMVLGMAFEMLGAGLVIPVIALLTQDDIAVRYPIFQQFSNSIGNPEKPTLVIFAMVSLITVYLVKNTYLAFLAWKQSKFIFDVQSELAQKLFAVYLRQPYTFHLQRNTANLIRNLQGEMGLLINSALSPCILICAESLVVLGLFMLLILTEPFGTLAVFGVLFVAGAVFHRSTKHHIFQWSIKRQLHEGFRLKQLSQGLGGVKDVKLLGREDDFLNQYALHTTQTMKMNQRQFAMQQMPRLWLELLAIIGLAILMITMILRDRPMADVLPTLALFAAISFRLMPSANRLISSFQQIRFSIPAVDLLHKELNLETDKEVVEALPEKRFEKNFRLENVSFSYPGTSKKALSSVSLTINKGELVGFVGESGSGKSTLIDVILGLLTPDEGGAYMDDINITQSPRSWQNQVGYVPQSIYLTDDTLRRNVAFGLADEDIDDALVLRALEAAQLGRFVRELKDGVGTIVGERGVRLSGGQRQRIGIARALYHNPNVLVFDEATSALDTETEMDVMESVIALRKSKTILIVAHRLSTVQRCDQIYRLAFGEIVAVGTPEKILH